MAGLARRSSKIPPLWSLHSTLTNPHLFEGTDFESLIDLAGAFRVYNETVAVILYLIIIIIIYEHYVNKMVHKRMRSRYFYVVFFELRRGRLVVWRTPQTVEIIKFHGRSPSGLWLAFAAAG